MGMCWLAVCYVACSLLVDASAGVTDASHVPAVAPVAGLEPWTPGSPGEVRCFCNLPICVTSGYMCKSARGGCFSDLFDLQDVYKARHGCVELLDSVRQGQCQNVPGSSPGHQRSLLLCCRSDMCNHVDGPEIKLRVNGHVLNATEGRVFTSATARLSSTEVWFKAATIAVPICGALILFLLIALAVKLLRTDGLETRFMPALSYADKKVPLLHVQLRNETNFSTQSVPNVHQCYTHYHNVDVRLQAPPVESNAACCKHKSEKQMMAFV